MVISVGRLMRRWMAGVLIAVAVFPAAFAQIPNPASAARAAQIDRNGVLILVRSSLLALDHANKTGNYKVLRDISAPGFQVNDAAKLSEIFAKCVRTRSI